MRTLPEWPKAAAFKTNSVAGDDGFTVRFTFKEGKKGYAYFPSRHLEHYRVMSTMDGTACLRDIGVPMEVAILLHRKRMLRFEHALPGAHWTMADYAERLAEHEAAMLTTNVRLSDRGQLAINEILRMMEPDDAAHSTE